MANLRANKITSTEVFETTGSVQFDGSGDVLTVPNTADFRLGNGDFTIECWFYYKGALSSNRTLFGLFENSSARRSYQVEVRSNGVIRFEWWPDGSTGNSIDTAASTVSISTWHHYAATRTNGIITQYLNGESVASSSVGTSSFYDNTVDSFRIGALNAAVDQSFSGHISNVRILKGQALYTKNFTPPTRELTVIPNTVLLACQSTTNTSQEATGKTITVNGNAVANELTPGLLTDVVKSGGTSAITGSVEFDGSGDALTVPAGTDFAYGTGDFTIECWINISTLASRAIFSQTIGGSNYFLLSAGSSGEIQFWGTPTGGGTPINGPSNVSANTWNHIAVTRSSNTVRVFVNGIFGTPTVNSTDFSNTTYVPTIGNYTHIYTQIPFQGFISNLRVLKGTALYTSDFIPPTRELKNIPGTVLLCCKDSNDPTAEETGKTITGYGDPAASNFTPQIGSDGSVEFAGPTKINSENYFYLPTGNTESRAPVGNYNAGTRGVAMGGDASSPNPDTIIDYITIASTGDAIDFGDLAISDSLNGDAVADHTRGVCLGGRSNVPTPNSTTNAIQFVTISSTGNSQDFGDLVGMKYGMAGFSDSTRGISAGGGVDPNSTANIDYITISSKGNGQDFGDCTDSLTYSAGFSSPTRGIKAGGAETPGSGVENNSIEYVTIQTTGNGQDFGDLVTAAWRLAGCSNAVRGVILEGETPAGDGRNAISYVTISTMGNAQEFGDATTAGQHSNGTSSSTRGVFMGRQGASPYANLTFIDFVHIMTTANAQDFGDLTIGRQGVNACSNGHGGLG
jgi:hypothetical protein